MNANRKIEYGGVTDNWEGAIPVPAVALPVRIEDARGPRKYEFSIGLGDIAQAPVRGIMCPVADMDNVVMGGVSGAIFRAADLDPDQTLQAVKDDLIEQYGRDALKPMPFTLSRAFTSGELATRRDLLSGRSIEKIIFTNTTPFRKTRKSDAEQVSACVAAAIEEATRVRIDSLAVPALQTGVLGSLSLAESVRATLDGLLGYDERHYGREPQVLNELMEVLYFRPTLQNIASIVELLRNVTSQNK